MIYDYYGCLKKPKNWLYRENREKNNRKNRTVKKNQLKFWKNRPVQFGSVLVFKPETEKPSQIESKPSQTKPNRKKLSQTGLNRFLF